MATSTEDDDRWSFSANWTIVAGSLSSSISLDSSDSTLEDSDAVKTPIVLRPPSSDSEPCEIKISFTQKQEVRQVYVRSTARVYEIYTTWSPRSDNDYLCTVRCGIATRDNEVLHATNFESVGVHLNESNGKQEKENCSSSEDDWVDVKVLDTQLKDDRLNIVREKYGANLQNNLQDLYEATAEFTGSDACTSLTLRLLSLQSKNWINIDEIYIFADPAESANSEAQEAPLGNSVSSSLMSVLVPTLLQLSKSSNAQKQDLYAPSSSKTEKYPDVGSKENQLTDKNEIQQEINEPVTKLPSMLIQEQELYTEQKCNFVKQNDSMNNRVESVLEQLVSRVSRIEDICLRFEENMINPIKSMEKRLQLVEEQVQVLVKNSQTTKLPLFTRFSAPNFSCCQSNSSSFDTEKNENNFCAEVELDNKDTTSDKVSKSSHAKFHPGLMISAPEFLCNDDEENNDGDKDSDIIPVNKCTKENTRKALSIDDALAAALSGFMANTSTQALAIKAPEFTIEENGDDEIEIKENKNPVVPPIFISESNETKCEDGGVSSSFKGDNGQDKLVSDSEAELESQIADLTAEGKSSNEITFPVFVKNDIPDGVSENTEVEVEKGIPADIGDFQDEVTISDDSQIANLTGLIKFSNEVTIPVSVKNDIQDAVFENPEVEVEKGIPENAIKMAANGDFQDESTISVSGKSENAEEFSGNAEVESEYSILENSIDSPWSSCAVDFELPILDVKFKSSEFSSAASYLEALFGTKSEFVDDVSSSTDQTNKAGKNDFSPNIISTDNQFLFDSEVNDTGHGHLSSENEALNDCLASREEKPSFPCLL